jgi:hypothetical protein
MDAKGYLRNHPFLLGETEDGEDYLSTDDLEMINVLAPILDEYHYLKNKEYEYIIPESAKEHLSRYTAFLLKEGYCDSDVYDETPTAIDQYLEIVRKAK